MPPMPSPSRLPRVPSRPARAACVAGTASLAVLSLVARGAAAPPGGPREAPSPTSPPSAAPPPGPGDDRSSPPRDVPDYDGREEPTTTGEVLLWIPRVALAPLYLVTEYGVRRPLGFLFTAAERARVVQHAVDLFTFGPERNIGIVPTAFVEFGFRPSIGAYFFWDDLLVKRHDLRLHAATGGRDWIRLTATERIPLDKNLRLQLRMEWQSRPDFVYHGIGPRSLAVHRSRYQAENFGGGLSLRWNFLPLSDVEAYTSVRRVRFGDATCCDDPSLKTRVARGELPEPAGLATDLTPWRQGVRLALDSRRPRPAPGTGARVELFAEHVRDLHDVEKSRWARYGGSVGGFVDASGQNRVLGLALHALVVDPLDKRAVPFTELAQPGGDTWLRGTRPGRLTGPTAAAASLEYRYPIWAFLDGDVGIAAGNVFGEELVDFEPELLRTSFWMAVRTAGERDHSIDLLIGAGTETIRDGAQIEEVRVTLGAKSGF